MLTSFISILVVNGDDAFIFLMFISRTRTDLYKSVCSIYGKLKVQSRKAITNITHHGKKCILKAMEHKQTKISTKI